MMYEGAEIDNTPSQIGSRSSRADGTKVSTLDYYYMSWKGLITLQRKSSVVERYQ